ncbi:MAG: chromosome segregation protein ScpA [Sphingomonadales bacterium]|nr:chromosome segregation protein ScpA [Sphingomonadales bacterium]
MSYEIRLQHFEGPFDLLLFFIERDELDIYDIPIGRITDEFLAYVRQMEERDIALAAEFIWVASSLMRIKVRMLLPRPELDEAGNEIDPRHDLVQKLLEYKRYKEVLSTIERLESDQRQRLQRGNLAEELLALQKQIGNEQGLLPVGVYPLFKAFVRAMQRFEGRGEEIRHRIASWPYSLADKKKWLLGSLETTKKTAFMQIFEAFRDKMEAIFTFLAILELLQEQKINLFAGEGYNQFYFSLAQPAESTNNE